MPDDDPREGRATERADATRPVGRDRPAGPVEWLRWTLTTGHPTVSFVREVLGSVLAVAVVGLLLFAASGIWPPMVAIESESMEPHMHRGDLVFVMEEHRLSPSYATGDTGVVTHQTAEERGEHRTFGEYGDVIVFEANGGDETPVIHRARFWVEEGDDWVADADPDFLPEQSCASIPNCPAPHDGFVTKGDNNGLYDQVAGISDPVRPEWIKGTAKVRVPWLGYVRLYFTELQLRAPPLVADVPDEPTTSVMYDHSAVVEVGDVEVIARGYRDPPASAEEYSVSDVGAGFTASAARS